MGPTNVGPTRNRICMTADEFLKSGRLTEAISAAGEEIKAKPGDQRTRIFLFELLCFSGDLVRAQRQLDAVAAEDAEAEVNVARYRNVLAAEVVRRQVLSGRARPRMYEPIPAYADTHLRAAREIHEGHAETAAVLLAEAQGLWRPLKGAVDGESFEEFRDVDDLLAPFLEAIIQGEYHWIPWELIRSISLVAPKYLRDLCWIPARLELREGVAGETFLPVVYPDSHLHSDELVRLGRTTVWRTDCAGIALGAGQRLFDLGDADRAMLEIRELEFDHANANYSSR
jgi:type VI secretion system protein ImpE